MIQPAVARGKVATLPGACMTPLAELRQAFFDLLMEVIDVAPAPQGVIELPGYVGFTAALIEDTQIVFRPQTGIPGIAQGPG